MSFNCHLCKKCLGKGCIGELPGMGGFNNSVNFQSNCRDWKVLRKEIENFNTISESLEMPKIRLAPITGSVENVGWKDEESFYFALKSIVNLNNITIFKKTLYIWNKI